MSQSHGRPGHMDRREFIRLGLAAGGTLLLPLPLRGAEPGPKTDVWVVHGADKARLMAECLKIIDANGGFGKNVKKLVLKVNAAWPRTPELGANTHPDLVGAFLAGVKRAGVGQVEMPEHPCVRAAVAFKMSGIQAAAAKAGCRMIDLKTDPSHFADVTLPKGRSLTRARVARQFLEADCLVNMPVAKHHRAATLTMGMKNWMGAVQDRQFWHRNDLHQCIADFSTLVKPTWTIIDATRVMLRRGPRGGKVEFLKKPDPNLLIVAKDPIAADAYATMLFGKKPADVRYLKHAAAMQLGVTDVDKMAVHRVEAPA